MDRGAFVAAAAGLGLSPSAEQLDALEEFEERLYDTNRFKNLTRVSRTECWLRHFIDSLLFHDLIPAGSRVLDIGTGPGFPAWPLACVRPDLQITAMDSNGKMIGFLETASLPNLTAVLARAEEVDVREHFDIVTGRAVAALTVQAEISAPLVRVDGAFIPMRTGKDYGPAPQTLRELGLRHEATHRRTLAATDVERVFPVYRKVVQTPYKYPRSWAEIMRRPLAYADEQL